MTQSDIKFIIECVKKAKIVTNSSPITDGLCEDKNVSVTDAELFIKALEEEMEKASELPKRTKPLNLDELKKASKEIDYIFEREES